MSVRAVPMTIELTASLRPELGGVEVLGGKGGALAELVRHGLPVPPTVGLSVAAYDAATSSGRLAALIETLAEIGAPVALTDDEIDDVFASAALPDAVVAAIDGIADWIGDRTVAVRSSATTEDLGGASFAGQHRSVLDVDARGLATAVRLVWASLWHAAPRAYRRAQGIRLAPSMAVVVQVMVAAERAGVCFTRDPERGGDAARVELVDGLAEGLVSGALTPRVHLVDRRHPLIDSDDGAVVARVVQLADRCADVFGTDQDVEWAWDREAVWVVQSRPITNARIADTDGGDDDLDPGRRYTTAGIGEMVPGVLPRLTWWTVAFQLEEAFRQTFDQLGATAPTDHDLLVRWHGRAALDLDTLTAIADRLPGTAAEDLERQYLGQDTMGNAAGGRVSMWRRARQDLRVATAHRRALHEHAIIGAATRELLDRTAAWSDRDDRALLAVRHRLVALGARAMAAELAVAAATVASFGRLESMLHRYLGPSASAWVRDVTGGIEPRTAVARARMVASSIERTEPSVLARADWREARSALLAAGRDELVVAFDDAARRAGSQTVFGGPTWSEHPDRFWTLVQVAPLRTAGPLRSPAQLDDTLRRLPGWRRRRILTGQVLDVRRAAVRRLVGETRGLLEARESSKADLLALGGLVREIDLELGGRLAARGLLTHADDVVHLAPAELVELVADGTGPVAAEIVARRRLVERWQHEDELPLHFSGVPTSQMLPVPGGDRMQGWGASAGRHRGPVRILRTPDASAVGPRDVVVAQRTDASWTSVFLRAGALVVEEGGPLSHAAIVAREFGLPTVVNLPGVVEWLRTAGADVTVDGDLGVIVRHDRATPMSSTEQREEASWCSSPQ